MILDTPTPPVAAPPKGRPSAEMTPRPYPSGSSFTVFDIWRDQLGFEPLRTREKETSSATRHPRRGQRGPFRLTSKKHTGLGRRMSSTFFRRAQPRTLRTENPEGQRALAFGLVPNLTEIDAQRHHHPDCGAADAHRRFHGPVVATLESSTDQPSPFMASALSNHEEAEIGVGVSGDSDF